MPNATPPAAKPVRTRFLWLGIVAVLAVGLAPFAPGMIDGMGRTRWRAAGPDWGLWFAQSPMIQLHVYAALVAFAIGCVILLRRKGTGMHRALGWAWVAAMAITAVSSLFITGINGDAYSFIHLISGWVIVALPMGIFAIRSKRVMAHRAAMTGMFVGGLVIAGALTG
ncbi:MAG: DUF2306 domain-containing protein [Hydrogenophilaceae bacterium]|jgi:uncharacterized membrane protein|nr:DUF2306 domain-containing protein [Hydrogenophilaceae bacterium]